MPAQGDKMPYEKKNLTGGVSRQVLLALVRTNFQDHAGVNQVRVGKVIPLRQLPYGNPVLPCNAVERVSETNAIVAARLRLRLWLGRRR